MAEDIAARVHAAIATRDWSILRVVLHPYVQWTDEAGTTVRGRTNVLMMLSATTESPPMPSEVVLRDDQVYRWIS
ncbi:MAG TPA: nuclear transport factor 2 family protein [Mycobacteriales bacterium]|nr:nuclear transport factor 2 family protein [Mycobacteriales bacterium]